MLDSLRQDVTQKLSQIRPMTEEEQQAMMQEITQQREAMEAAAKTQGPDDSSLGPVEGAAVPGFDENDPSSWGNPGRNQPCPCGSGKKFKHCHGRLA